MTPLPIDAHLDAITTALRAHRALVLVAEPGAGKTTRVPPAIVRAGLLSKEQPNLVMLQPRRIAARAAAARIAEENGWTLGEQVGYQVRFEKRITARTRLRVVTEAILTRQLLDDPSLDGIGCVVLDEFHERSIHSDLAIALLSEVKQSLRDDLMLIVMSATLDAEPVAKFLGGAPIVRVPGRTFPVDVSYRPTRGDHVEDVVAAVVREEIARSDGHILVFLPGAAEIQRAQEAIGSSAREHDAMVLPLHGSLPFDEQQRAIAPSGKRKIVLATNIAETSLTIDGVKTVIDSGLARVPRFDPQRGLDALNLQRISNASATQRAGRAGRTAAGRCVRLWTQQEHAQLDAFDLPEIASVDLAPTVLDLHAWGQSDINAFGWFEKPPADTMASAERLLKMLGALDANGKITALGKRMQAMPVHPRLARLLIGASDVGAPTLGANVAALLSEKDFVNRTFEDRRAIGSTRTLSSSDVGVRLHLLESAEHAHFRWGSAGDNVDLNQARQVVRARDQLLRLAPLASGSRSGDRLDSETLLQQLVLLAYPDRVCRRRTDVQTATMVGGVGVRLDDSCSVLEGDYFVAVDPRADDRARAREAFVRIASRIDVEWLEAFLPQSIARTVTAQYDAQRERVVGLREVKYLDLVLQSEIDPRHAGNNASVVLRDALRGAMPEWLERDETLARLVARVRLLARNLPEKGFPALDDASWDELLEEASTGKVTKQQVRDALLDTIRSHLVYPLDRLLDAQAPDAIEVPTGSNIRLQYNLDPTKPPVLAVRLQEMFGLVDTPRIADGRVPVLLHLLGPNYRPVQITQDLASFWKNTYPQVRKDLRADYPKHSWPDDPLTAPPVRGARRRPK